MIILVNSFQPDYALPKRLLQTDPDWNAPLLWRSEFRNVLAGYLRRRDLKLETALQIADGAEEQMRGREFSVPSTQVLARAEESGCSAHDCEFVVLAEELGVALITSDVKRVKPSPRSPAPSPQQNDAGPFPLTFVTERQRRGGCIVAKTTKTAPTPRSLGR